MKGLDLQNTSIAWEPQPGPQTLAIQCPATELMIGGAVGGGKLLSDDTKVVTPFGYRLHGELKVGDTISAADGTPTKVVLVTKPENHMMYRVTFDDGGEVVAGDEHLWNYSVLGSHKSKTGKYWRTGTTLQMKERLDSGRKVAIPLCKPVKFTKAYNQGNPRRIDPYVLGALLGDGHLGNNKVSLTSEDDFIACKVIGDGEWTKDNTRSNAFDYRATGETRLELIESLDKLGVYGKTAEGKFVPYAYMWWTVEDRFEVLRGLMDTDGFIDERGQAYYTTISKQLADDVRWLVFSLGGRARITSKIPTYKHNGEKRFGKLAYTVTIRMPDNRDIVSLPRKQDRANAWRENGNGELKRRIKSIEYVGDEKCHCIAIDHPDSLYMVEDFIVTHNTDYLLADFGIDVPKGSAWQGIYFRKYFPDMDRVIQRSKEIFAPLYGIKCYSESKYQWNFPSGACLRFRALEKDNDVLKYQGQDYSWIAFDELTQWKTPYAYTYLFAFRLRSAKGVKVRMRCSSNPGGPGMQWVKARFIDAMPPGTGLHVKTKKTSYWRVFIPSRLEDNQILMKADPGYADRIMEFSDKSLAKAMREGDWDSIPNAAFTEFDKEVHVIDPAPIPTDRPIWRSMDWGFKTPYSNLHVFTSNDGDIIVGNEIYGWSGTPNVGTEEYPSEVRDKIVRYERSNDLYVPMGYLDNQCWEEKGQKGTIYNELSGGELVWKPWKKGPNSRVLQKQGLHDLMKVVNGRSRLKIMRNCIHLIRTLPLLPVSKLNMEDIDTDAEDHSYDALRGGLTKKMPTRRQLRDRAIKRQIQQMEYVSPSELQYGGF